MLRVTSSPLSAFQSTLKPNKLATAIGLLAVTATTGVSTYAQDTSDSSGRLEEIIVTSQKRMESLQDVPISVATVGGEKLNDASIDNLEDLTAYLPNIHFTESGFSTQVRVRGIGSDNSQGFEQSVGMYVDGVYYGRAQLFRAPMMDMERAELLRGPQGTLFGKNSIAGALNLTTAKPTEELEGKVTVSYEMENEQDEVNAYVSGPITDTLRARLAVRSYEEQGYYENTHKDVDEPHSEETTVRLSLDWTPTDNLSFMFKAEKNEFETLGRAIEITQDIPLTADEFNYRPGDANYADYLALFSQPTFESDLDYKRQTDVPESSDNEITNLTLTTNYEFEDLTLTLVTGSLKFDYTEVCDCDFTSADILRLDLAEDYEQFSQEIRLTSPVGEKVEWIAGVFYQDWEQTFVDELPISDSNLLPTLPLVDAPELGPDAVLSFAPLADTGAARNFEQTSDTWAMFGRVTWNVSDDWHLTFGARYTEETKKASKQIYIYEPSTGNALTDPALGALFLYAFRVESTTATSFYLPDDNGILQPTGQPFYNSGHDVVGERDESAFTPLVNVEYDINGDMMAYASFTSGFKAGGFDPRSNSVGNFSSPMPSDEAKPQRFFEFDEEEATAAEIGLKSTLADGRGELNVALYRTDYENLQISQFDGAVGFNVGNAKETRVQGIELDGRWLLADGLTASYGFSWLDFEYLDFKNGNCYAGQFPDSDSDGDGTAETCDYTGKRGVYTPEYTVNLSLDYYTPITDTVNFVGFIDVQQVDGHNVHVNLDPKGEIDAYTIVNARVGIEAENWAVAVLGKNLLDESVISYSANAPLSDSTFGTNTYYSFVRRPMTVALEATLKF
ncbi:Pesticin receptor [Thalassocella blandensis]|nr:Pesticin receptor [Thalassocella blandensis]